MAKVNYPLYSFEARGNIKKCITYSKNVSGNIVKKCPKSRVEPSEDQEKIRGYYSEGVNTWNNMTEEEKKIYDIMAIGTIYSGYNLFIGQYISNKIEQEEWGKYGSGKYGVNRYAE